jgi:hypothetical protein
MIWAASRRGFRRVWAISIVLLVIGIGVLAIADGDGSMHFLGVFFVVLSVVYSLLPLLVIRRQARRLAPIFAAPATFTLTDIDVTAETPDTTHILRWSGVSQVKEVGEFWVLYNRVKAPVMTIPRDCMTPQDVAEFRAFVAGRSLMPSTYRVG